MKFSEKTEYKHVYKVVNNTCVNNKNNCFLGKVGKAAKRFNEAKQAAKWVDLYLISIHKEPVNFFKKSIDK